MDDRQIVELYWQRSDAAIAETERNTDGTAMPSPTASSKMKPTPRSVSTTCT